MYGAFWVVALAVVALASGVDEGSDANASLNQLIVLGCGILRLQYIHLQAFVKTFRLAPGTSIWTLSYPFA